MYVLDQFLVGPKACSYLAAKTALTTYELVGDMTPEEYEERMNGGWRKFGHLLFRPVCEACDLCRPLRIPVAEFRPNRSQRRTWKENLHREVRIGAPKVDRQRLDLYQRYHAAQGELKGWPVEDIGPSDYAFTFVKNPIPAAEISVWEGKALRSICHVDLTPNTVSAIYHFYDPDHRQDGLGTHAILQAIELARRLGKPYVYLGYYVAGSMSMEYKAKFQPHELLTDGVWQRG